MMDRTLRAILVVTIMVVAGMLAGCERDSSRLGWVETTHPGHLFAIYEEGTASDVLYPCCLHVRYDEFTGTEVRAVPARPGDVLALAYDAQVTRGTLSLMVQGPDEGVVWFKDLQVDCCETVALPVREDGRYKILVRGEATAGGFALEWAVQ